MSMDFHSPENRGTYAGRKAPEEWLHAISSLVDPNGARVADVGCGGGIYSLAWRRAGASRVVAVDSSLTMLEDTRQACGGVDGVEVAQGSAEHLPLGPGSVDVVFARALVHHLADVGPFLREALRVLRPGGTCIVQDRTINDVRRPASPEHLRGIIFECFPRLLAFEASRRPSETGLSHAMMQAGFLAPSVVHLWETRRSYQKPAELALDLRTRRGRTILHELTDAELEALVEAVLARVAGAYPAIERDPWTLWVATKAQREQPQP
jgi:ubiquinone/menaquinone biosynthesis C-methylase UbiE